MIGLVYDDVIKNNGRLISLTSLEQCEFEPLAKEVDEALKHQMKMFTLKGEIRKNKNFRIYKNTPLKTPNDRLLFVLMFLKNNITQELMATIFDMPQPKVHYWLYNMLIALRNALRNSGDAPSREKNALLKAITDEGNPLFARMVSNEP